MQTPPYPELKLLIDGQWRHGSADTADVVLNPATNAALGELRHASDDDLADAVAAAGRAFAVWRDMAPVDRSAILRRAAGLLRERNRAIASALTMEQGKVLAEALLEVEAAAASIDWMAEEGRRAYGRLVPGRLGVQQIVQPEPVGIVAAFCPWNFPVLIPARKISAALAAGCPVIIKPSEETPGAAVEMAKCLEDAGLPKGALNMVFGIPSRISEYLIRAEAVRKVSFTGSVEVGRRIAGLTAEGIKRVTMELGGHAPVIVCADANIEKSISLLAAFKHRNAGQVCISPTRFYVHDSVCDSFVRQYRQAVEAIQVGNGLDPANAMGPLANERRVAAVEGLVDDVRQRGGTVLTGGRRIGNSGNFFEPTIVTDIDDVARIMTEEPFGPITPIARFSTLEEVVERANSLPLGLAAYAFTEASKTAREIGERVESGMIGINTVAISTPETPFGGVKESGYGQECGIEGLDAYLHRKFVAYA
ncbi:NAD-dependent succinate-semialdehyde dehydrogenase [Oricola sp.]|uniref:NAD-dependent succinate-semialdehyde dehydrogenase n=1 Tax=Oricola sp. TaxID=1979950 RepID=UPI00351248EF